MTGIGAVTDRGRAREENQDRYLTKTARGVTLLAVADGVGGEAGGELASTAAVDALAGAFDFGARDTAGALAAAMRATNDAVVSATSASSSPFAASTLVAAAVRGRQVAVANLGDSRAYVIRGATARQVTTDHSGEQAHSITRFVGDPRGVSPDVFIETLGARDRLVLCSDGLTRHVAPEEIAALARGTPGRGARALVDLANKRGGEDNVTVIVYAGAPSRLVPLLVGAAIIAVVTAAAAAWALSPLRQTSCCMPPPPSPSASASPSPSAPASASPTATP